MSKKKYLDPEHERDLIAAAQSGDVPARNMLILACLPFVRQTVRCYATGADQQDVDDLEQQAITALYDALEAYDLAHPKRARLYVFAYSRIREVVSQFYGDRKHLEYTDDFPPPLAEAPDVGFEAEQTVLVVRDALARLTGQEKHVIYARRALDKAVPRESLARDYGCSQQWISKIESRAAEKLAQSMLGAFS